MLLRTDERGPEDRVVCSCMGACTEPSLVPACLFSSHESSQHTSIHVSIPRPSLRITRRLGDLPGLTRKAAKRSYPPGQHGQARRKRSNTRSDSKKAEAPLQLRRFRTSTGALRGKRAPGRSTGTNLPSCWKTGSIMFASGWVSGPPFPAPANW